MAESAVDESADAEKFVFWRQEELSLHERAARVDQIVGQRPGLQTAGGVSVPPPNAH